MAAGGGGMSKTLKDMMDRLKRKEEYAAGRPARQQAAYQAAATLRDYNEDFIKRFNGRDNIPPGLELAFNQEHIRRYAPAPALARMIPANPEGYEVPSLRSLALPQARLQIQSGDEVGRTVIANVVAAKNRGEA